MLKKLISTLLLFSVAFVILEQVYGATVRTSMGQRHCVGIIDRGSTTVYHDVLPRLHCYSLRNRTARELRPNLIDTQSCLS
jgi:hypothetical protein